MGNGANSKVADKPFDEKQMEAFKINFANTVSEVQNVIVEHNFEKFRLKMENLNREQRKLVSDHRLGEHTCLTLAVKQRSLEFVKYLLDMCGAEPETTISWSKRGKTNTEDVPLLCWTCITGNNETGKLLMLAGADVNYCNSDGENLLHISYRHQNKKYGSDSSIVDIEFISNLLRAGTRVNQVNRDRNTLLHLAHQVGDIELCKLLLYHGANSNLVNKRGFTAVEEAAIFVYAIEQEPPPRTPIEILLSNDKTLPKYKINALELLGTRQIRSFLKALSSTIFTLNRAYHYWERAISLKTSNYMSSNDKVGSDRLFLDAFEPFSIAQLHKLSTDNSSMVKLGIVFAERILGLHSIHTITLLKLFAKWYNNMGQARLGKTEFEHVIKYILRNPSNTEQLWFQSFQDVIMFWFKSFELLGDHHCDKSSSVLMGFLNYLEYIIKKPFSHSVSSQTCSLILYITHAIAECGFDECNLRLRNLVDKLNKLDLRQCNQNLLYLAVKNYIYENNFKRRSLNAIQIMLEQGMSANTVDPSGDTPLLMCLDYKIQSYLPSEDIKLLLIPYSHLDIRNKQDKTALSLLKTSGFLLKELQYRNLQCLSAYIIKEYKIPFKGRVPRKLESFIEMH